MQGPREFERRRTRCSSAKLCASLVLALAGSPAAAEVNYTLIAHSDDASFADLRSTVPAFGQFRFAAPAINAQGTVSFLAGAIDNSAGDTGLFTGTGSSTPSLLLETDGNGDEPTNPFDFISSSAVPISATGDIAFGATLKGGGAGIFRVDAGTRTPLAVATDRLVQAGSSFAPGLYDSVRLRPSMNDHGDIVFAGVYGAGGTAGVFSGADPLATRIVDTTMTGRQASFWLDPVVATGGVVGAITENFDPAGPSFFNEVAAYVPGTFNERALASTGDGTLDRLQPPTLDLNDRQQAIFRGLLAGLTGSTPDQQLLVAQIAGAPASIADAKSGSTGLFPFRSFDGETAITNNGLVAFSARSAFGEKQLLTHQLGRTTVSQGNVYAEVLRTNALLDNRTVQDFSFTREGVNERGEFAFIAHFSDGTSAVYKANFGSTAPGVVPQPGLRAEVQTRRYAFANNTETLLQDVDSDDVPGHAIAAIPGQNGDDARADALNDATGSHLKAVSRATASLSATTGAEVSETRAKTSVITNWTVANPNPGGGGPTQETLVMLVITDGTLLHDRGAGGPSFTVFSPGRLSSPGGAIAHSAVGTIFPDLPLVAEVNFTVNANVGGNTFNAFGGYASLRNGDLIVAGDWDPTAWTVTGDRSELRASINTFQTVEYTIDYDETFALEFIIETYADTNSFFGNAMALADFSNTARFVLSTRSGAPVIQLGTDGTAVVPLPAALWFFAPALGLLTGMRRHSGARAPRA